MNTNESKHTDHVIAFLNRDMMDYDTLVKARAEYRKLIQDRDELLAALQFALTFFESAAMLDRGAFETCAWETLRDAAKLRADQARAAIANATQPEHALSSTHGSRQAVTALAKEEDQNWIIEFDCTPVIRLSFERNGKPSIVVGTEAEAIRYSHEEAAEVAVAIGRGAEAVIIPGGDK